MEDEMMHIYVSEAGKPLSILDISWVILVDDFGYRESGQQPHRRSFPSKEMIVDSIFMWFSIFPSLLFLLVDGCPPLQ
jgi:hypothetical protein